MSDTQTSTPEEVEVVEHAVPILIVKGYDVLAAELAGMDVVSLILEVNDGEDDVILTCALPSEDALQIARSLIHVANTVRPFSIQTRIIEAAEASEESNSK